MNGVKAQYGTAFWILVVVMVLFTFGMGIFIFLWMRTMWIDQADGEGVSTISGRRFSWAELTNVERTTMTAGGARVGGVGGMIFGNKKVLVNTMLIRNDMEVLSYLGARFGGNIAG